MDFNEFKEKFFDDDVKRHKEDIEFLKEIRGVAQIHLAETIIYRVNHDYSYSVRKSLCSLYPNDDLFANFVRFLEKGSFEKEDAKELVERLQESYNLEHFVKMNK